MKAEIAKVLEQASALRIAGHITELQFSVIEATLSKAVSTAHASSVAAAIDWTKLLEMFQKFLPILVQILPLILAIVTPKQPPDVAPVVPEPTPNPNIGVK